MTEPERDRDREADDAEEADAAAARAPWRSRPGPHAPRSADEEDAADEERRGEDEPDKIVEGVVELLANGSGFVRLSPPEPTDDDVYISAAQVKRCELVSGDRVAGPLRPPRRSERFPSLVRVDTINGRPADEVAEGTRFEDLPVAFPAERFELGSEDPTVKAIEWLTPFGKGSRVVIAGPARAGKSEALRRLARGARRPTRASRSASCSRACARRSSPSGARAPAASASQLRRLVRRAGAGRRAGGRAGPPRRRPRRRRRRARSTRSSTCRPAAARRALAAARNIVDGGSLTVDRHGPGAARRRDDGGRARRRADRARPLPGARPRGLGRVRPELLVGDAGAEAIAKARAEALPG